MNSAARRNEIEKSFIGNPSLCLVKAEDIQKEKEEGKEATENHRKVIEVIFTGKEEGRFKCVICGVKATTGSFCRMHWIRFVSQLSHRSETVGIVADE